MNLLVNSTKVLCDKTYDYIQYYTFWRQPNSEPGAPVDVSQDNDKKLSEFDDMICTDLYKKEEECTRLFELSSYYDEYSTFFGYPTHIIDNIYLGSSYNAADYKLLMELDIQTIINVTSEISNYHENSPNFTYLNFPIYDNNKQSIKQYLNEAYVQIKHYQETKPGSNILVHCFLGASRSASILIYYMMHMKKGVGMTDLDTSTTGEPYYTFDEALQYIRERRRIVNPTFRFTKDLISAIKDKKIE